MVMAPAACAGLRVCARSGGIPNLTPSLLGLQQLLGHSGLVSTTVLRRHQAIRQPVLPGVPCPASSKEEAACQPGLPAELRCCKWWKKYKNIL